jgi:hypothetical protein
MKINKFKDLPFKRGKIVHEYTDVAKSDVEKGDILLVETGWPKGDKQSRIITVQELIGEEKEKILSFDFDLSDPYGSYYVYPLKGAKKILCFFINEENLKELLSFYLLEGPVKYIQIENEIYLTDEL